MRMAGQEFLVGEFLTLEDDTLGFRVARKTKEGIPKAKKDPRVYPEDWRKPEVWKGDHFDTWDPLQVGRHNFDRGCLGCPDDFWQLSCVVFGRSCRILLSRLCVSIPVNTFQIQIQISCNS